MWFNEWFGTWHSEWYGDIQGEEPEPSTVCDFVVNYVDAEILVFGYYDVEDAFIRPATSISGDVFVPDYIIDSIVAITCPNNVQETTVKQTANNVSETVVKQSVNKSVTTKSRATANTVTVVKNDCG